jgi:hypothetical protein
MKGDTPCQRFQSPLCVRVRTSVSNKSPQVIHHVRDFREHSVCASVFNKSPQVIHHVRDLHVHVLLCACVFY